MDGVGWGAKANLTENVVAGKTGKPCRKPIDNREWPWENEHIEARRLWQGGWALKPGGGDVGVKRIDECVDAGYVFAGVGQVKVIEYCSLRCTHE